MGILIPYEAPLSILALKRLIRFFNPPKIVSVGDQVTLNLISSNVKPDLAIIDGRVMRKSFSQNIAFKKVVKASNPPGTISLEAINAIEKAFREEYDAVVIDGEEDLLVLPLIMIINEGGWVIYGLPFTGLVTVICDKAKKRFVKRLMEKYGEIK